MTREPIAQRSNCPKRTWAIALIVFSSIGCGNVPGRPAQNSEVLPPDQVKSFQILYTQNCAGCHGKDGWDGPATPLANPAYEDLIDDPTLRDITAKGQPGTLMPGFSLASGGPLTDAQIDVLAQGMRNTWRRVAASADSVHPIPPYAAQTKPNLQHGSEVYARSCAHCHGAASQNPGPAGSVLDGTFLALISDQVLRTAVIAGRPDLGMPGWQNEISGKPLSDQDITDVVAWIGSHRAPTPGQPYPTRTANSAPPIERTSASEHEARR